jgi:hypothetical protein
MEIRDLAPGLWIWRLERPDWTPNSEWEGPVTSTCFEVARRGARPRPARAAERAGRAVGAARRAAADRGRRAEARYVRDVDAIVARYGARARQETPMWLPEQRTIVFADALTAPRGELRV